MRQPNIDVCWNARKRTPRSFRRSTRLEECWCGVDKVAVSNHRNYWPPTLTFILKFIIIACKCAGIFTSPGHCY